MTQNPIVVSHISGPEFVEAMNKLETASIGLHAAQFYIALLGMSIVLQYPDIGPEELQSGIKGASEWIAMYLDSLVVPTEDMPKELVN